MIEIYEINGMKLNKFSHIMWNLSTPQLYNFNRSVIKSHVISLAAIIRIYKYNTEVQCP